MWNDFKKFVLRGNILELAIGVVLGGAFGKIVSSFVGDILMPPIGLLLGKVDFTNLFVDLSGKGYTSLAVAQEAGAATLNYGIFFNTLLDFVIIAFVIFLLVRQTDRFKKVETPPVTTKECPFCCTKIPLKAKRCPQCTSELTSE